MATNPRAQGLAGQNAAADFDNRPSFWTTGLKIGLMFVAFNFFSQHMRVQRQMEHDKKMYKEGVAPGLVDPLPPLPDTKLNRMISKLMTKNVMPYFPHVDEMGRKLPPHQPLWQQGQAMDLYVYFSAGEEFEPPVEAPEACSSGGGGGGADQGDVCSITRDGALLWEERGLVLDFDSRSERGASRRVALPPALTAGNGSAWAHVYLTHAGVGPSPADPTHRPTAVTHHTVALTRHKAPPARRPAKKLLAAGGEPGPQDAAAAAAALAPVGHWKPQLALEVVHLFTPFGRNQVPPQLQPYLEWDMASANYYPVLQANEFWLLDSQLLPLNASVTEVPLELSVGIASFWKFQLLAQMQAQFALEADLSGDAAGGEADSFRKMLMDTSPWLLAVTFIVTTLHSIFDFLAFKNDVQFWKGRKNVAGLSVRTIMLNCFFQTVIFLYLLDNKTSWMILISSGVGTAIEYWKVTKALRVELGGGTLRLVPRDSYVGSHTKEHDDHASRHLLRAVVPLVIGYSVYSLLYREHASWYSWALGSLVSFIYTFGFVLMTPQLYINYKLKSVAHLPWRVMVYKSLNTFIDDLFAFIIEMPTMHRLACLRDDLIFFIFLYQKWIYPTDKSRTNEYGQQFEQAQHKIEQEGESPSSGSIQGQAPKRRSKFDRVAPATMPQQQQGQQQDRTEEGKKRL